MKLLMVIIQDRDSDRVIEALVEKGLPITRMASTGGFLRKGNVTLMIGIEQNRIDEVIDLLKLHCSSNGTNRHAATIFTMDMPEYMKI